MWGGVAKKKYGGLRTKKKHVLLRNKERTKEKKQTQEKKPKKPSKEVVFKKKYNKKKLKPCFLVCLPSLSPPFPSNFRRSTLPSMVTRFSPTQTKAEGREAVSADMSGVSARHLAQAGERGLANPVGHNNCFLNSVLQVLYHLRDFRTQLIAAAEETLGAGFCDDDNDDEDGAPSPSPPPAACALATGQRLLRRVAALFLRYQRSSSDDALLDPSAIRSGISQALPGYAAGETQDAHECLDAVLTMLDTGLRDGGHAGDAEADVRPRRRRRRQPPQRPTLPYRYFGVHTRVSPACGCGEASGRVVDTDAFYLTVWEPALVREGFDNGNRRAFHDLISGRGRDKPIECDTCKTKGVELVTRLRPVANGDAGKQAKAAPAVSCPPVLVVNVSWAEASATREELRRFVSCVPVRWRVADALPGAAEDVEAELVGVVFYYGQHYVSALRNEEHNVWAIFDDSRVRSVARSIPELWRYAVDGCLMPFVLFFRSAKTGGGADAAASRLGEPELDSTSPAYNPNVLHSWLLERTRADLSGGAASSPPPSRAGASADAEAAAEAVAVAAVAEAEAEAAAAAAAAAAAEAAEVAAAAEAAETAAAAAACQAEDDEVLKIRRPPPQPQPQDAPRAKKRRRTAAPVAEARADTGGETVVGAGGGSRASPPTRVFAEAMGGVVDEELRLEMSRLQGKTPQALLNSISGCGGCDIDASLTADEFLTLSRSCRPHP